MNDHIKELRLKAQQVGLSGGEFKEWRQLLGLTQEGVAQHLVAAGYKDKCWRSTVCRWEKGVHPIPGFVIRALEEL